MSRTLRALAVLVLVVVFLASPVTAASRSRPTDIPSLWDSVWAWVMELVLPDDGASQQGSDGGELPPPETDDDAGGTIDPNGG